MSYKQLKTGLALIVVLAFSGCVSLDKSVSSLLYESALPDIVTISTTDIFGMMSVGAGFFIEDDLLITAKHVIQDANSVDVIYRSGLTTNAINWNSPFDDIDIGIVRVKTIKREKKANFSVVRQGEIVRVIGSPFAYPFVLTAGIVASSEVDILYFGNCKYILIDCRVNPGNSGCPVLDSKNRVIGMVIGYIGNLGVVIPSRYFRSL